MINLFNCDFSFLLLFFLVYILLIIHIHKVKAIKAFLRYVVVYVQSLDSKLEWHQKIKV